MKDKEEEQYFNENYDLVFDYKQIETTGGYEIRDAITNSVISNRPYYFQDSHEKCRFCGRTSPNVTFKDVAHTYPEFLGNKFFRSKNNECDECNHKRFGETLENDLRSFLLPFLSIDKIRGKGGQAKYKSNDKMTTTTFEGNTFVMKDVVGSGNITINEEKHEIKIKVDVPAYSLFKVYKSLLKMALASVNEEELSNLTLSLQALNEEEKHGTEIFYRVFYYGYNLFCFEVTLFKKKVDDPEIPTFQFSIRNENFMLQIPIFSDKDIQSLRNKNVSFATHIIPTEFDDFGPKKPTISVYQIAKKDYVPAQTVTVTEHYDAIIPTAGDKEE